MPKHSTTYDGIQPPSGGRRGPRRLGWDTYEAIAQLVGKPLRTVMQHAKPRGKKPAKFDPKDLDSVLRYVLRCGWPFTKERR